MFHVVVVSVSVKHKTCSRPDCEVEVERGYCKQHHAEYMRQWRSTHPPSDREVVHGRTRAYTNVLIKRGKLVRGPCIVCETKPSQAHHPDYKNPRLVIWLCPVHHRALHRGEIEVPRGTSTT